MTPARGGRGGSRPASSRRRGSGGAPRAGGRRPLDSGGRGATGGGVDPRAGGADVGRADTSPGRRGPSRGRARPWQLTVAAGLVAVEGAVSVAYAVYLAVLSVVGDPAESVVGVGLGALIALLLGVGLLAAARALRARRGGPRGAVTTVQLLAVLTAVSTVPGASAGWVAGGVAAVALGVSVLVLLFSAPAREALA